MRLPETLSLVVILRTGRPVKLEDSENLQRIARTRKPEALPLAMLLHALLTPEYHC